MYTKIYYLLDGSEVELIQQIGKQFLVKPILRVKPYISDSFEEEDDEDAYETDYGSPFLVDDIFIEVPKKVYQESIEELKSVKEQLTRSIEEKKGTLLKLEVECASLSKKKTDFQNLLFNLGDFKNAKKIAYMPKSSLNPVSLGVTTSWGGIINSLKLFVTIQYSTYSSREKETEFYCGFTCDSEKGHIDVRDINKDFGILINPTEDEIREKAIEVNSKYKSVEELPYNYETSKDEYLPLWIIEAKKKLIYNKAKQQIQLYENSIKDYQKKLETLKKQQNEAS